MGRWCSLGARLHRWCQEGYTGNCGWSTEHEVPPFPEPHREETCPSGLSGAEWGH